MRPPMSVNHIKLTKPRNDSASKSQRRLGKSYPLNHRKRNKASVSHYNHVWNFAIPVFWMMKNTETMKVWKRFNGHYPSTFLSLSTITESFWTSTLKSWKRNVASSCISYAISSLLFPRKVLEVTIHYTISYLHNTEALAGAWVVWLEAVLRCETISWVSSLDPTFLSNLYIGTFDSPSGINCATLMTKMEALSKSVYYLCLTDKQLRNFRKVEVIPPAPTWKEVACLFSCWK